jgi:4-hydroxy-tetrahydrodipicolinate synthase
VYAYTIPDRDGNVLSPAVVRALAAAGLGGLKDSSKSLDRHREYLACGVDVLMGSDALVLDALRLGAAGAVSAIANVEPRWLLELARDGSRDTDAATGAQARIDALRERTRASTSAIAALKRELATRLPGYPAHVRLPLS